MLNVADHKHYSEFKGEIIEDCQEMRVASNSWGKSVTSPDSECLLGKFCGKYWEQSITKIDIIPATLYVKIKFLTNC